MKIIKGKMRRTPIGQWIIHTYPVAKAEYGSEAISYCKEFFGEPADKKTVRKMLKAYCRYHFWFDEYVNLNIADRSADNCRTFIADYDRLAYADWLNDPKNHIIFDNKAETYKVFRPYYRREACGIPSVKSADYRQTFIDFVSAHPNCIIKPIDSGRGIGIRILRTGKDTDLNALFDSLLDEYKHKQYSSGGFIVEELIQQSAQMARFHPSSVNTLRILTIGYPDRENEVIHALLRVGRNGSEIDNASAGGIACSVDVKTGILVAAWDKRGNRYIRHPDTGEMLIGVPIPRWEEAVSLAKKLADVCPDNHYTGWDLALTDDGWVMVEGNDRAMFGFQQYEQTGFRPEYDEICRRLGKKTSAHIRMCPRKYVS